MRALFFFILASLAAPAWAVRATATATIAVPVTVSPGDQALRVGGTTQELGTYASVTVTYDLSRLARRALIKRKENVF